MESNQNNSSGNGSNNTNNSKPGPSTLQRPKIPIQLIIKFSNKTSDLTLDIEDVEDLRLSDIRRLIRERAGGILKNRRLRLISAGKVLNDQTNIARDVARISIKGKSVSSKNYGLDGTSDPASPKRVYIHCAVGDILSVEDIARENELDSNVPSRTTLPEARGFDRLRNAGFTNEDINQIRSQFTRIYGDGEDENDAERQTLAEQGAPVPILTGIGENEMEQLEEQWLSPTGNLADNNVGVIGGDYLDDLIGLIIGMFLGVMVLFIIRENGIFSKRQQKSIIGGAGINVAFAIVRMFC